MTRRQYGVRSASDIKDRCVVGDGGCWIWRAAFSACGRATPQPTVWMPDTGKTTSAARAAWRLACGDLPANHMVWRTCGRLDCVNPKHGMAGTRQDFGAWQAAQGILKGSLILAAKNTAHRRRASKLTAELIQWARESSQPGVEVAHAIGITDQHVSKIRRGRIWAPPPASSVFAWRPNMAQGVSL